MDNTARVRDIVERRPGILYPVMLIAAITVIVFSVAGIATMMGWLPSALSHGSPEGGTAGPRPAACAADCGVIESIRIVELKGEGSGLGAVGGAVVGGLLGTQVGRGNGRTAATVVGAGAGAYAGHEIEKSAHRSVRYQVRVRMEDGSVRTFLESAQPALAVGQKVRVTGQGMVVAG